ncbi:S-adenosyl-L-methionine-dependent methyltransferase [Gaertneriomyces semiglobifer]|nr:S-adenosyl-L-methionine-dependent methyltransferase [Gaertneriomyces semiglobifer]
MTFTRWPLQGTLLRLIGAVLGVPLLVNFMIGAPLVWYLVLLPILGLPVFAGYNVLYAKVAPAVRPQKGLPGKNLEEYMTIKKSELAGYKGRSKIPIETFFENYFDGHIDIKEDMLELLEVRHDWASFTWTMGQVKFFLTQWIPETLWHSKKQDEDQVRDHYDRGDDFYEAFLGPMMIYTSGIMSTSSKRETLEELQQNKLDLVCKKVQLKPGHRMLDIGCGWGTLSVHAAKQGAKVTGVTLGKNQAAWGTRKAEEAGVAGNVNILCEDYRDIPAQKYDRITCLEMAEHVGVLRFQTFLTQVREMLEDDGIFFMQIAGLRRAWQYEDLMWGLFMAKYVFPGADASTPLNWYIEQLERAGFEVAHSETLGVHYSATIYRWYSNWLKNKDKIIAKYGTRWYRIWEYFLAYSTIVARQGSATVYQLVCHKNLNSFDRSQFIEGLAR